MDRNEADRISQARRIAAALRGGRAVARAKPARRGQGWSAHAMAGLGMIVTLMLAWAMTVHP